MQSSGGISEEVEEPEQAQGESPAKGRVDVAELSPEAERAIQSGLRYLSEHQNEDGSWGGGHRAAVTALSLAGVVVGQNLPREAYLDRYGTGLGSFIMGIGLSSVFTSWYFLLLVSVLAAIKIQLFSFGSILRDGNRLIAWSMVPGSLKDHRRHAGTLP